MIQIDFTMDRECAWTWIKYAAFVIFFGAERMRLTPTDHESMRLSFLRENGRDE